MFTTYMNTMLWYNFFNKVFTYKPVSFNKKHVLYNLTLLEYILQMIQQINDIIFSSYAK